MGESNGSNGGGENFWEKAEEAGGMQQMLAHLARDANIVLVQRILEAQEEGADIDLGHCILTIRMTRLDGGEGMGQTTAIAGTKGERPDPEAIIETMAQALSKNCEEYEYQDPLARGAAFEWIIRNYAQELLELTGVNSSRWARLKTLFSLKKRMRLLEITKRFLANADYVLEHGLPPGVGSLEDLSTEDFQE